MKEKNIRSDIIEASINSYGIDNMVKAYNKALILNKLINQEIGQLYWFLTKELLIF